MTVCLLLALAAAVAGALHIAADVDLGRLLAGDAVEAQALSLRLQRLAAAAVAGAALSLAGVLLQTLLRNPLASPDILGVSAGASLAVAVVGYFAFVWGVGGSGGMGAAGGGGGVDWRFVPALVGALVTLGFIYALSQRGGLVEPVSLILVGVVVGVMCGAGLMLVQQLRRGAGLDMGEMSQLVGAVPDATPWLHLSVLAGMAGLGLAAGLGLSRAMDASVLSDDEARSVGVRLDALRVVLFLLSGGLTTVAVVLVGPVGFVGLVCPHVARLLLGRSALHGPMLVGSAWAGAAMMALADAATAMLPRGSGRLPVGVVTAIIGGAVFIALLRRRPGA